MPKIILATRNPSKAEQIKAMFPSTVQILTMEEAGIEGEAIEDGDTLFENAEKKARYAWQKLPDDSKTWTMADDTGLFIQALGGQPGIHAARWAGKHATTEEIMKHTLRHLEGAADRSALFKTAVVVISPQALVSYFLGSVKGHLLESPRCQCQPKMPYSAIFVPEGETMSWAEMSIERENAISHRGIAFRKAREFLEGKFFEELNP